MAVIVMFCGNDEKDGLALQRKHTAKYRNQMDTTKLKTLCKVPRVFLKSVAARRTVTL